MAHDKTRLALAAFLTLSALPLAGAGRVQEEAGVAIVEVPVYVKDRSGAHVSDLSPDEFRVYEDGKLQELAFVQLMGATGQQAMRAEATESTRHFVLFFDLTFNDPAALRRARDAAIKFVESRSAEKDPTSVFSFSLTEGVTMLANFTTDRSHLIEAISSIGITRARNFLSDSAFLAPQLVRPPDTTSQPTPRNTEEFFLEHMRVVRSAMQKQDVLSYRSLVRDYLDELAQFARALDVQVGRKYVIFFSGGFDAKVLGGQSLREASEDIEQVVRGSFVGIDPATRELELNLLKLLEITMSNFSSSDCRIYCVDPAGLSASGSASAEQPQEVSDLEASLRRRTALEMFASETGGRVFFNRNDLDAPLQEVLDETRQYYLLAYTARPTRSDGSYHRIKVEVTRPGMSVSHRKGYYESKPFKDFSSLERNLQIADIVNRDRHHEEVSLNAQALVFSSDADDPQWGDFARVLIQTAITGAQFEDLDEEIELELYAFASNADRAILDYFHGAFKVKQKDQRSRVASAGISYADVLLLPPGDFKVKLILRENKSGRLTVRDVPVTVPDFQRDLRMATPCFLSVGSEWLNVRGFDPAKPPERLKRAQISYPLTLGGKTLAARIYPDLSDDTENLLLIKLYNLATDPGTNNPRANIGWEIVDSEGRPRGTPTYSLKQGGRSSNGVYELLFEVAPPPRLSRGLYWLKLKAVDLLSGMQSTESVPFFIEKES